MRLNRVMRFPAMRVRCSGAVSSWENAVRPGFLLSVSVMLGMSNSRNSKIIEHNSVSGCIWPMMRMLKMRLAMASERIGRKPTAAWAPRVNNFDYPLARTLKIAARCFAGAGNRDRIAFCSAFGSLPLRLANSGNRKHSCRFRIRFVSD